MIASEEILKSLATLEQNLKDIDSAKNQVVRVVKSSEELAATIASYESSFKELSSNIKQVLDKSKELNLDIVFKLSEQTDSLKHEVSKLIGFDFNKSFQILQKKVVDQFEKDLAEKLIIIDTKAQILQEKSNELKKQIVHLRQYEETVQYLKIDLIRKLNLITQSLDKIQNTIDLLSSKCEKILQGQEVTFSYVNYIYNDSTLKDLENKEVIRFESIKAKLQELNEQNNFLFKNIKANKIIILVFAIILTILLIIVFLCNRH